MDDIDILKLFSERKENAIEAVHKKYGKYCYSIAYKILQNDEDAEECVNDSLMKLWEISADTIPHNLKAYLAKIARNIAFARYNSEKCLKRGGIEFTLALEEVGEIVSDSSDAEKEFFKKEFTEALNRFLKSIPERECTIFISRYFSLESITTIAKNYRLKENNVSKILSRTRKKLKIFLEREGYVL
jgi:RNA polymerase sigma-70 factor (ECF subfamily)